MQGIWYGDRRDRVKWGALVLLAKRFGVPTIVQIAYFRGDDEHLLDTPWGQENIPPTVWKHFSELRNIRAIERALKLKIPVFKAVFDHRHRANYIRRAIRRINEFVAPRIVFLDPDTGIIAKGARAKHVSRGDLQQIWKAL